MQENRLQVYRSDYQIIMAGANAIDLRISTRQFTRIQMGCVSALTFLGAMAYMVPLLTGHDHVYGIIPWLDVGSETSLPTFFASFNLLIAALLSYLLYIVSSRRGARIYEWNLLAIAFVYLSLDEATMIHEKFDWLGRAFPTFDFLSPRHSWLVYGFLFASVAAILGLRILARIPPHLRIAYGFAGIIFAVGALGFELLGSVMIASGVTPDSLIYQLRRLIEEALELFGIALFNVVAFRELALSKSYFGLALNAEPDRR